MKIVEVYQCSFCTFFRKTKKIVSNHEHYCFLNPENRACATCKHNVIDHETFYNPNHGGNPGSTGSADYEVAYNFCTKKDIVLEKGTLTKNCPLWKQSTN